MPPVRSDVSTVRGGAPPRGVPGPAPVRLLRVAGSVAVATFRRAWEDRILGLSAEAAFWQLLSLPPLLLAGVGTLGYVGPLFGADAVTSVQHWVLRLAGEVAAPGVVSGVVEPMVAEVLTRGRPDVVSLGFAAGLWAGSSATATFVNTITLAYGQRELRGAVRSRLLALKVYLGFLAVASVLLSLGVAGVAEDVVRAAYWPLTGLLTFLTLATLYHVATPVRLRWRRAFPGAALAVVLFGLLSYLLRLYFETVASQLLVFSALAAPILALLYFYVLAFAILLGAELNATLEQRWPRGTRRSVLAWLAARLRPGRDVRPQPSPSPPPPSRGSDS